MISILFFCILLILCINVAYSLTSSIDVEIMVGIAHHLPLFPSGSQIWNPSSDPCYYGWHGITCVFDSKGVKRINKINLSSLNLNVDIQIFANVSRLSFLSGLDLSYNNIYGIYG